MAKPKSNYVPYREKLLDPRWQKKRLEVLERCHWSCRHCNSKDKTLHVHHAYYLPNRDPWDYPDKDLSALCEDCHKTQTQFNAVLLETVGPLHPSLFQSVLAFATGVLVSSCIKDVWTRIAKEKQWKINPSSLTCESFVAGAFMWNDLGISVTDGLLYLQAVSGEVAGSSELIETISDNAEEFRGENAQA